MKSIAVVSALIATVAAQAAFIFAPAQGDSLTAGQNFITTITKPNSLTGSVEMGVAIYIKQCGDTCDTSSDDLGTMLYVGEWNPQYGLPSEAGGVPYQNWTFTVPSTFSGNALMSLAHTNLVGLGPYLNNEFLTTEVTVASA